MKTSSTRVAAVLCLLLGACALRAQPSGGPYGPLAVTYEVPRDAAHVFYVAPDAKADAPGATLDQPTTIASALARAVTGDAIIMRGGVYRTGGLQFNQGVTIQPYRDEHPVWKGTLVADQWEAQRNGLWRAAWPHLFPAKPQDWWRREWSGRETPPWRFNNDMVFVDGELLHAVGWEGEIDAHSYCIDYDKGQVYLGVDPAKHRVEITAFDNALTRTTGECYGRPSDHRGPVIRGLTFTQYAYRAIEIQGRDPEGPADPATFGKDVTGTLLENVTITFCSRVAGYFRGDGLVIRHCLVSDTRTEGIFVLNSSDVLIEKNIVRRNNIEKIAGYYPAAVKIFNQCHRVTVRDNLITDLPHSNGVWFDVGEVDARFIDNWVEGAVDGFFFEISKGAIVAGNVCVNCEHGIRVLNSSNVQICHNTLVNTNASIERTERSAVADHFGWHPATGPDVDRREGHVFVGNLVVVDEGFARPLFQTLQAKALCGKLTRPQLARLDGNVYVRRGPGAAGPLMAWSPADGPDCAVQLAALDDLRKLHPEFEAHSRFLDQVYGAVFEGADVDRYALALPLGDVSAAGPLPAEVLALLGWSAADAATPGAYPRR